MKKLTAVFISALLMTLFLSCSDNIEKETSGIIETEETVAVDTAPPEYSTPGKKYDGAEFVVAAVDYVSSGTPGKWVATSYCEAFAAEQNGDPLNDAIYLRNRTVEETLEVELTVYSLSSFANAANDFKKTVLAADDVIDYALINVSNLPSLLGTDMLTDLYSLDVDFSRSYWDQNSVGELELFGTLYAVTGDISLYSAYAPITYFFNKNLTEEYALGDPYDKVRSGSWTLDAAFEMSRKVAKDLNGNGKTDIDDSFGMLFESASLVYMVRSGGVRLTQKDSEGIPQITVNTERTSRLVELCVPFLNDKATNILAGNYTGYDNTFTDLMLPMFIDNRALFYNNQMLVALNLRNMNADFGVLPPPKYDAAQENYYCPVSDWWATFVVVPVTNGSPEMTSHVIDAAAYYSQQLVRPAYIDTTVLNKTLRDEDSVEMVELIFANRIYDLGSFYNWGNINGMFANLASGNNTGFASAYASAETKIRTELDKTITALMK
ncbi:MAG: hypothetical protein PHZ09_09055 [Eubacteriales bacterium]|nr:hypothetical protein [Eubacteriales bacterium]